MAARNTTRMLGYGLLGLVMIGLVGFGSYNFGGTSQRIGTVGDTEITATEYFNDLTSELQAFQQSFGTALPMEQAELFGIDRQVLARLISRKAEDNEAERIGLSVGDASVRDRLLAISDFTGTTGTFDRDTYEFVLEQNNLTPAEFEESLRTDLARAILERAVVSGAALPGVYVDTLYAHAREGRDFTWAQMGLDALETEPGEPTEDDLGRLARRASRRLYPARDAQRHLCLAETRSVHGPGRGERGRPARAV